MKKIICIHAHFSNSPYLAQLFQNETSITLEHYVIPDFLEPITTNNLTAFIKNQITENVTAIIITCTMYSNIIKQKRLNGVPVFRVEDPLLSHIAANPHKKCLIFSNPKTVDQTMTKLETIYCEKGLALDYEVEIVPNVFDLILTNQKAAYQNALLDYLNKKHATFSGNIYLMQLSMSIVSKEQLIPSGQPVYTILDTLDNMVKEVLSEQ